MKSNLFSFGAFSVALVIGGCGGGGGSAPPPQPGIDEQPAPTEHLAGGAATSTLSNDEAFGQAAPAIRDDFELDANFKTGNQIFRNTHDGLGPLLNSTTCQGCHIKDGRGEVPASPEVPMTSMFMRVSDSQGNPDPVYGGQLQTFGIDSFEGDLPDGLPRHRAGLDEGLPLGEAYAWVTYETVAGQYDDGTAYELRRPTYRLRDATYGDFVDDVRFSPRVSPSIFGSGLLGAIPASAIEALADEQDSNGDGISGRVSYVDDPTTGEQGVARFGYKLGNASVLAQSSGAYRGDMGVANRFATEESCTSGQQACIDRAMMEEDADNGFDISDYELALVEFYVRTLAVPQRRGFDTTTETWDAEVLAGRKLFFETGCANCHNPSFPTAEAAGSVLGDVTIAGLAETRTPIEPLTNQTIFPFSDLLLHDMGGECQPVARETAQGEACDTGAACHWVMRCTGLADGRPDGMASGTEWRTQPLWGLGLVKTVNPDATYLHDGRARTPEEAILWHGGEAEDVQKAFKALSQAERVQLLTFLESL